MGFSGALMMIAFILFSFFVGTLISTLRARLFALAGGVISFVAWLGPLFVVNYWQILFISFFFGAGLALRVIPFSRYAFSEMRQRGIEPGTIFFLGSHSFGKIISVAIFIAAGAIFPNAFYSVFIAGAITLLYFFKARL
jgi:hypothetical protein